MEGEERTESFEMGIESDAVAEGGREGARKVHWD